MPGRQQRPFWSSSIGAVRPRDGWRSERTRKRIDRGDNHHRALPGRSSDRFHRSANAEQSRRRHPAGRSRGRVGLRSFLRLGAPISARTERKSFMPQPFVPVGRPRARLGDRVWQSPIPGEFAVLGAGDGGFLMSLTDLETAVRLKLRMCILIYNDSSYAAEVHLFRRRGHSIDIVQFPDTDFAAIARGHGARAVHRQDARRSRTSAGLGEQGRPGRIRNRCQDKPRPGSRLARRAFPVIAALSSVPHSRPDCLLLAQGCHLSVMRLSGSLPDVLRTICSRSVLSSPEAALDPKPNRAPSEHVASEAGRLHWRAFRLAG